MSELLSKEQLAEIEHRKAYQYGSMVSLTVAERDALLRHIREQEAELDSALQDFAVEMNSLRARLREVETRETVLANALAEHYEIDATECKAVSAFRVRAIEAVRALSDNQLSITTICARLEMLPAASEPDNRVVDTVTHRRDCGMSDCFICYGGR